MLGRELLFQSDRFDHEDPLSKEQEINVPSYARNKWDMTTSVNVLIHLDTFYEKFTYLKFSKPVVSRIFKLITLSNLRRKLNAKNLPRSLNRHLFSSSDFQEIALQYFRSAEWVRNASWMGKIEHPGARRHRYRSVDGVPDRHADQNPRAAFPERRPIEQLQR